MAQPDEDPAAPDAAMMERLAQRAIAALPPAYRDAAARVVIRIDDFPSEEIMAAMAIEDPFELTGLYEGIPLTEKSVMDQPHGPDMIWLFRRPILDEWVERGDVGLAALVAHVLVHELAHHFGWTDDQIAAIDRWWE